jgi:hypothetical protein
MDTCQRTAAEAVAATGVGYCLCRHEIRFHGGTGCRRCAELIDRPRVYGGERARGQRPLRVARREAR